MTSVHARNAYRQSEAYANIHPVKLIHMLYDRVLTHLESAIEGVEKKNPQKRGENVSRAIAIITELNASISETDESEAARFLRGLYSSILMELPKAALTNDIGILKQAHVYMKRLQEIWEQTAMQENGLAGNGKGGSQPLASKKMTLMEKEGAHADPASMTRNQEPDSEHRSDSDQKQAKAVSCLSVSI